MKKDFEIPEVKGVSVAIVPEVENSDRIWDAFIINENNIELKNVLISSEGYKKTEGVEDIKTSVLRHMIEILPPKSYAKIESISEELFLLNNQFWVSFQMNGGMYDKKYIFLADSIQEKFFTDIPLLKQKGVLIS